MTKTTMNSMTLVNAEIVNLTPHTINIIAEDGSTVATYPSVGNARASQQETPCCTLANGVEVVSMEFGKTVDLPAPEPGKLLIVSTITVSAARAEGRTVEDLVIPATPVRNDKGVVIGSRKLAFPA